MATVAIGKAGAKNAALLAAQILGIKHEEIRKLICERRESITQQVMESRDRL